MRVLSGGRTQLLNSPAQPVATAHPQGRAAVRHGAAAGLGFLAQRVGAWTLTICRNFERRCFQLFLHGADLQSLRGRSA
jgi:hypothetical protein